MALLTQIWDALAAKGQGGFGAHATAPASLLSSETSAPDPYQDHDRLKQLVVDHLEEAAKVRWAFERNWFGAILYYLGVQWIRWDPRGSRWRERRLVRKWVPKPVTNRYASSVDAMVGAIQGFTVNPSAWPATMDADDLATAEVADRIIPIIDAEIDIGKVRQSVASWMVLNADAFLLPMYDQADASLGHRLLPHYRCLACNQVAAPSAFEPTCPGCGQATQTEPATDEQGQPIGEPLPIGKLKVQVYSPLQVYVTQHVVNLREHREFTVMETWPLSAVQAHWPEQSKGITQDSAQIHQTGQYFMESLASLTEVGGYFTGRSPQKIIMIYRHHKMPSEEFPDGVAITMAGDQSIMEAGPSPYFEEKDSEKIYYNPLIQIGYREVPGRLYSKTPAYDAIPKQDQLNRLESLIEAAIMKGVYSSWLLPTGSSITNLTGEPSQVIRWTPHGTNGAKPEIVTVNPVPPILLEWKKQIEADFEEIFGCLVAETAIPCLDGTTRTMKELAEHVPHGGVWVYGFDRQTMRVVPAQIQRAWMTGVKHCVRVAFSEGTYVDCTDDHPFLTWDRGYIRADELRQDEPIVPLVLHNSSGYVSVSQSVDRKDELVHRMIAFTLLGLPRGEQGRRLDVHHKDGNRLNNDPGNLEILTRSEHRKRTIHDDPQHHQHLLHPEPAEQRRRVNQRWKGISRTDRKAIVLPMLVARLKRYDAMTMEERREHVQPAVDAKRRARLNHRVALVTPLGEREVYDLQTSTKNFATAAGVFVHNSYDAMKGTVPRGVSAGYAIQLLTERSYGRLTPTFQSLERGYTQLYDILLKLAKQYFTEERLRRIRGDTGQWQVEAFKGADLKGAVDIKIEGGSVRPRSKLAEQALIESLAKLGVINPGDARQSFAIAELFGMQHVLGGIDDDKRHAAQEWQAFLAWEPQPPNPETGRMDGGPSVKVVVDNHVVHIMDHQQRAKTDRFDSLSVAKQLIWQQHIMDHMGAMQPAAPPPGQKGSGQAPPPAGPGAPAGSKANEQSDQTMNTIREGGNAALGA